MAKYDAQDAERERKTYEARGTRKDEIIGRV